MNNRVVLFGGSFDPPHLGHLLVAQWVAEMLACPVRFLPNGRPPHKNPNSSKDHRLEMLRLAIGGNPLLSIDESELQRNTVNYTVDTLKSYRTSRHLNQDELFFVLGSDSLNSLETWREPEEIIRLCTLVVYEREPIAKSVIDSLRGDGAKIILTEAPVLGISSSLIRERVKQGKSTRYFVPDSVSRYILDWNLYKEGNRLVSVEGKDN